MGLLTHNQLAFIFGLLGNIISFMVFLAPVPTFYTIYKKKTSEGFHSIPYIVALMSAMLLLYYGLLKPNGILIVSINAIGCFIELSYIFFYLFYAPHKEKILTIKILVLNIAIYGLMMLITMFVVKGDSRITTVGWICAAFSVAVFAAPLSIMRRVIKTRSVEYMPFTLSFFLTLCATMWFFYGLLVEDMFIALPNVLGFLFGIVQMVLYNLYKNAKKDNGNEFKPQKDEGTIEVKLIKMGTDHENDKYNKEIKKAAVYDIKPSDHSNEKNV
ncbi:bidirectional sugar transporter SWEET9-like [Mercurialis annua]|uniref:bidirectional sugar transporter SWEET9-like n=1 Tax=Mercurialis annua TaxID=3986 RepID=UPI00215F090B|nr:bidirectional sugar transporter SWEET9-like [Mercurialis annua]